MLKEKLSKSDEEPDEDHEARTAFFRPRNQIRAPRPIPTWKEAKNAVFSSTSEEDNTTDSTISKNGNGGDMWAAAVNPDDYVHCDNDDYDKWAAAVDPAEYDSHLGDRQYD